MRANEFINKQYVAENAHASTGSNQLVVKKEDPMDLTSDFAYYIVGKGNELIGTFKKLFARANSLPPEHRETFYNNIQDAASKGDLGDIILKYSRTLNVDDLLAISDVMDEYGVMFHDIVYPDDMKDYEAAWKQYAADVVLARTHHQPGHTMHEQGMAEGYDEVGFLKQIISDIYPRGGDRNEYFHLVRKEVPKEYGHSEKFKITFNKAYDEFYGLNRPDHDDHDDEFDYTDRSMRRGEQGMEEGSDEQFCENCGGSLAEAGKASRALCKSSRSNADLGASQLSSCKAQGLRGRESSKRHEVGGKRQSIKGMRIKGHKYGGPLPYNKSDLTK